MHLHLVHLPLPQVGIIKILVCHPHLTVRPQPHSRMHVLLRHTVHVPHPHHTKIYAPLLQLLTVQIQVSLAQERRQDAEVELLL